MYSPAPSSSSCRAILCVLFILIGMLALQHCLAAEIDSITPRKVKLENSVNEINEIINQRLEKGIQNANEQQDFVADMYVDEFDDFEDINQDRSCDEEVLYGELRKAVFDSFTASWGLKGYDLDKQLRRLLASKSYSLLLNDSVYRDIDYIEGFSLNIKELSDVVNIDGHLIGLDKIGHFFAQGWQYFEMTNDDEATIIEAIEWGRQQEAGLFGYTTTGIYSYADLVANLNGWRFWNRVLLKQNDPLKGVIANFFTRPYVTCEIQFIDSIRSRKLIRAWEFNSRFDLSDYVDAAWDEGNNCNSYADPIIEHKIASRIQGVYPDFLCPVNIDHCQDAQDKYGDYARYVLHPSCLMAGDRPQLY
jgi:hypothetical protein